ncbi:MAG: DUF1565 domain-containing protein [Brevibacterium yomogidense]
MAYTPRDWTDVPLNETPPAGAPALDAANLSRIEDGISAAHDEIDGRLSEGSLSGTIDAGVEAAVPPAVAQAIADDDTVAQAAAAAAAPAVDTYVSTLPVITRLPGPVSIPAASGWDTAYWINFTLGTLPGGQGMYGGADVTPEQLFDAHSTARSAPEATFWVSPNGIDTNAGTQAAPFRSIGQAIQAANTAAVPTRINVAGGLYSRLNSTYRSSADIPAVDIALVATGGRVDVGQFDAPTGMTPDDTYTNTYSQVLSNCERLVDTTRRTAHGLYPDLLPVATAALCNDRPGTWALQDGRLYVNRLDGAEPTAANTRIYRFVNSGIYLTQARNFYMGGNGTGDGFDVSGGAAGALWVNPATPSPTNRLIVAANCTFRYAGWAQSANARGVTLESWNGLAAFFNCDASGNATDGFNAHNNKGAAKVRLLTVNCSATDNGRGTALSCQGLTTHGNVVSVDLGGRYVSNRGGNVFNVNTSRALLAGTYCRDDQGDIIHGGTIPPTGIRVGGGAQIWCDRTMVDQPRGTYAYYAEGNGTIHKRGTWPAPQPDAGAGTFTTY